MVFTTIISSSLIWRTFKSSEVWIHRIPSDDINYPHGSHRSFEYAQSTIPMRTNCRLSMLIICKRSFSNNYPVIKYGRRTEKSINLLYPWFTFTTRLVAELLFDRFVWFSVVESAIQSRWAQPLSLHSQRFNSLVFEFIALRFFNDTKWEFIGRIARRVDLRSLPTVQRSSGWQRCSGEIRSIARQDLEIRLVIECSHCTAR